MTKAYNDWFTFERYVEEEWLTVDEWGSVENILLDSTWFMPFVYFLGIWLIDLKYLKIVESEWNYVLVNSDGVEEYTMEVPARYAN